MIIFFSYRAAKGCLASIKLIVLTALFVISSNIASGQTEKRILVDSLLRVSTLLPYSDPDSAIKIATIARDLSLSLKDSTRLAESYFRIMGGYYVQGQYADAFQNFLIAKDISHHINNQKLIARSHGSMALFHESVGNFLMAIDESRSALRIYKKIDDGERVVTALNNLGQLYMEVGYFDSARVVLSDAEHYFANAPEHYRNMVQLQSLRYFVKTKNFAELKRQLPRFQNVLMNGRDRGSYHWFMAEINFNDREFQSAHDQILLAVKNYRETKNLRLMYVNAYPLMVKILTALGRYKDALQWSSEQQAGLTGIENQKMQNMVQLYGAQQKRNELLNRDNSIKILTQQNDLQRLEIKQTNLILAFSIFATLLLVVLSVLIYARYKTSKEKELLSKDLELARNAEEIKNKQILLLNTERQMAELKLTALRAQMNPHFIFNALTSIQSCIYSNRNEVAMKYLSRFAKLLRMILETSDQPVILLTDEIKMLQLYMDLESLRFNHEIVFTVDVSPELLRDEKVVVPSLILQPFVENSVKHAFRDKQQTKHVTVKVDVSEERVNYTIEDNGVGYLVGGKSQAGHQSKGLDIVHEKLETFASGKDYEFNIADLSTEGKTGTRVHVAFPYVIQGMPEQESYKGHKFQHNIIQEDKSAL